MAKVPQVGDRYGLFTVTEIIVEGMETYVSFPKKFKENFDSAQKEWVKFTNTPEGKAALWYISQTGA